MNAKAGSWTKASYRCLCSANQGRLLLAASCSRKVNTSLGNPENVSKSVMSSFLPPIFRLAILGMAPSAMTNQRLTAKVERPFSVYSHTTAASREATNTVFSIFHSHETPEYASVLAFGENCIRESAYVRRRS